MSGISAGGGVGAIQAGNLAEKNQQVLQDAFRKLASSLSINRAADNAASLAIAERFNTEVQGVNQATLNTNDGIAVTQIAESGLQQIQEGQQRLRELAVQSANGALQDSDRRAIQAEATQIQEHIASIVEDTNYNGQNLLTSSDKLSLQTGPDAGDQSGIKLTDFTNSFTTVDLSTQSGAEQAITSLMVDSNKVSTARAELGAAESGLNTTISQLSGLSEALSASGSRIQDADIARETSALANASIRANAGIAIQAQANQSSSRVHQLVQ
ncbi:MAG: flagellin [Magnetococcales bacterium]|nr:flagellin [Magnetococcales bacterium]